MKYVQQYCRTSQWFRSPVGSSEMHRRFRSIRSTRRTTTCQSRRRPGRVDGKGVVKCRPPPWSHAQQERDERVTNLQRQSMIPPHNSLVKYDNPVLVSTTDNRSGKGAKKKGQAPPVERQSSQTEDILNSILPPREWTDDGQLWVQYVSSTPATRLDVTNLQEQLDHKLQQRQARETGICPVREELYSQCFDELIRQVTINCAERGLLLLRVRDEIHMTIAAYQTMYESSIAFGIRKALIAEQRKAEMESKIRQLQEDKADLERQVTELSSRCEQIKPREAERRAADEKRHNTEVEQLKRTNEQLKTTLGQMLSAPKK